MKIKMEVSYRDLQSQSGIAIPYQPISQTAMEGIHFDRLRVVGDSVVLEKKLYHTESPSSTSVDDHRIMGIYPLNIYNFKFKD